MRPTRLAALTIFGLAGLAAGPAGPAGAAPPVVYDAFIDYSTTSNPTTGGVWSYGYETSLGGTFTPYAWNGTVSTIPMWARTSAAIPPQIDKNTSGTDYIPAGSPYVGIIFPGTEYVHMHPGQAGEYCVLRWTAPASGTYNVAARFRSLRAVNAPTTTDVHMLHNGVQFVGGNITVYYSAGDQVTTNAPRSIAAGDTIDFVVGFGTGGYQSDSTGIAATITLTVPAAPPSAPTNLIASYADASGVSLSWTDTSTNETGFRVERKPAGYAFALLTSTGADVTTAGDTLLYPSTTFIYRVRSFNTTGDSAWSNEASITTTAAVPVPAPPRAPSQLAATTPGDGSIALDWTDNSSDELRFDLERAVGGADFKSIVSPATNVTHYADFGLHPGWISTYRVRGLSLQGPSPWSNNAAAVTPGTIDVKVVSGSLTDSPKPKKDKLALSATYTAASFDAVANGLELQLGAASAPVILSIPPGSTGWKVKTKKGTPTSATWKSAKGALPKVTIVVDLVKHTFTAGVSGADFSSAPAALSRFMLATAGDGGAHVSTWIAGKPGVFQLK